MRGMPGVGVPVALAALSLAVRSADLPEPADGIPNLAHKLYEQNPAQHLLSADVQVPALEEALRANRETDTWSWNAAEWSLSESDLRDLLLLWTRWYGIERDEWVTSWASVQLCVLDVCGGAGAVEQRAEAFRRPGGLDAYALDNDAVLAFGQGYVSDLEVHEDLVCALYGPRGPFEGATVHLVSRLESSGAAGKSWLVLEGRMSASRLQGGRWAARGTRLTLEDLLAGVRRFRSLLTRIKAGRNERTGRIVFPCSTERAAAALARRVRTLAPQAAGTRAEGKTVRTVLWDTDLAALLAHDAVASRRRLFPSRTSGWDQVRAMKAAVNVRPCHWARSRRKRLQFVLLHFALPAAIVVTAAVAIGLIRRRRERRSA